MPEVETGSQLNTLVQEGVNLSRSVIWLDELQNFFADETLTAASVRQLVLGRQGACAARGHDPGRGTRPPPVCSFPCERHRRIR